jgi:RNA polymerase sigma-70 factor (ECF subfamily)
MVRGLHGGRLRARLGDSDLVQDALLEAQREFPHFRGSTTAELTAWLRRIVLRTVGHAFRRHLGAARRNAGQDQPLNGVDPIDSEGTPLEQAVRSEQAARLAEAMARLPDDMQQLLLGRHLEDLPYSALAERLGRSEAALRVLYIRALRRLREVCREVEE